MLKSDLIAQVGANAGVNLSKADIEKVLDSFRDVVQATVRKGEDVSYPGLGKFSRVQRKARQARNPRTGEAIKVPASKAPKFTASATLRSVVNGKAPAPRLQKVQ